MRLLLRATVFSLNSIRNRPTGDFNNDKLDKYKGNLSPMIDSLFGFQELNLEIGSK